MLDKGANPFLINSQGLYPYHLTNNKEILEMLPSKNVNDPEDIGNFYNIYSISFLFLFSIIYFLNIKFFIETPQVDTLDVLMGLALLDLETATAMRSQSENRGLDFSLSYNVEKNSNSIYDNFFIDEYVYEGMGYNTENCKLITLLSLVYLFPPLSLFTIFKLIFLSKSTQVKKY